MKTMLFALLATVSGCLAAQAPSTIAVPAGDATPKPIVAVSTFENNTGDTISREVGRYEGKESSRIGNSEQNKQEELRLSRIVPSSRLRLPDVSAEVATSAVGEALINSGKVRVADLSPSVQSQISEMLRNGDSDWQKISTNMDYLVVGSINSYNVKNEVSTAYGVERWKNTVTVSLSMKLFKVSSKELVASKTLQERVVRNMPHGVIWQEGLNDDWQELLCQAINSAVPKFIDAIEMAPGDATTASPMVSFDVKSMPTGADVEYNNNFVGNTPCTITVPAAPGVLRVTLAGYEPWEKRLIPNSSMQINPTLQKIKKTGKGQSHRKDHAVPQQ